MGKVVLNLKAVYEFTGKPQCKVKMGHFPSAITLIQRGGQCRAFLRVGVPERDLEFTALDRLSLALLKQAPKKRHSEINKRVGREEEGNR